MSPYVGVFQRRSVTVKWHTLGYEKRGGGVFFYYIGLCRLIRNRNVHRVLQHGGLYETQRWR